MSRRVVLRAVGLERLDQLVQPMTDAIAEDIRVQMTGVVKSVTHALEAAGPRLTGRFNASWFPFVGRPLDRYPEPGETTPIAGDPEIEATVKRWQPGESLGTASALLYTRRLAFHGWSKKVSKGWMKVALAAGLAAAESAGGAE